MALLSHFNAIQAGFRPKTLIKPDFNTPSPVVKPLFAGKSKKPLFYKLLTVSAVLSLLIFPVATASAGFFSSMFGAFNPKILVTNAESGSSYNSQTLRVLEPAVNIDPNPFKGDGDITVASGALVPESGPSGTSADIAERPATSEISVYIVHKGDTLSEIASMFGVSKDTIMWANDIQGGIVHEGQSLVILPITGVSHTVAAGDTIESIAKKYNASASEIRAYNGLSDGRAIVKGEVVIIPDGEVAHIVATTLTKKKTAATKSRSKTSNPFRGGSGSDLGGYFIWPADGGVVTQGLHGYNGIDVGVSKGTAIYAAAAGTVIVSRDSGWNGGYGDYVVISHDNGVQTLYAHLSQVTAQAGVYVNQGDLIGYSGMSGKATGPHLHFEVRGAKNPFTQ